MNDKFEIIDYSANIHEELWDLAIYLYKNPETGYEEFKACKVLSEFLKTHGFDDVEIGSGGVETAFVAAACPSGIAYPQIDILAEYDALGLGDSYGEEYKIAHACGHNIIAATAVGAGCSLLDTMRKHNIPGTLRVVGTPAEEGGGGKIVMQEAGIFDKTDAMIMLHPTSGVSKIAGRCKSSTSFHVKYHGFGAHAGNHRDEGINAQDAAVICYTAIACLRYQLPDDAQVFVQICNTGEAKSIIPDLAEVSISIRCFNKSTLDTAIEKIKGCIQAGAVGSGCTVEYKQSIPYYGRICYHTLEKSLRENTETLGEKLQPGMIDDSGGEDFGNLIRKVPGIMIYPSLCLEHRVSLHTLDYLKLVDSQRAKDVVLLGSRIMASTVLDWFNDTSIIDAAKEELREIKKKPM